MGLTTAVVIVGVEVMSMLTSPTEELTRALAAPLATVTRAFSDPGLLEGWLFHEPSTRDVRCLQLDLQRSGLFRVRYRRQTELMPIEHHYVACGAFEGWGAGHLVFAYSVLQLYPLEGVAVAGRHHVQLAFEALGAKTRVRIVTQTTGVAREPTRWGLWLDALERLVGVEPLPAATHSQRTPTARVA